MQDSVQEGSDDDVGPDDTGEEYVRLSLEVIYKRPAWTL
jgi:hypothetical protein